MITKKVSRRVITKTDHLNRYHCEDGPALVWDDGDASYYIHGRRHREDGPAVIWGNRKEWVIDDLLHRLDGPAFIEGDYHEWWINGCRIECKEHYRKLSGIDESLLSFLLLKYKF